MVHLFHIVRKPILICCIFVFLINSCIEKFTPGDSIATDILVVDALLTDEAKSYEVLLSKTRPNLQSPIPLVNDATVSISSSSGKNVILKKVSSGKYATDGKTFFGKIGERYVLYIKTSDGREYQSDTCTMYGTSIIDSIYFAKATKYSENGIDQLDGLSIYLDGNAGTNKNLFLRWDFAEDWETMAPYPPDYKFNGGSSFTSIPEINRYCWKQAKSSDIVLQSFLDQEKSDVKNKEMYFVVPSQSDRFNVRYSMIVNQYSISKKEYDYWNKLKETTEDAGGFFDKQPFSITGNIININDSKETVLGYFQVSSVSSKRLYIDPYQLFDLRLPLFKIDCNTRTIKIGDTLENVRAKTLNDIYNYIIKNDSVLIMPNYNDFGIVDGMVVTKSTCANCSLEGNPIKPAFWLDK